MTPNVVELKESQCFNATHGRMGKPVPINFSLIEKPVIHLGFILFFFIFYFCNCGAGWDAIWCILFIVLTGENKIFLLSVCQLIVFCACAFVIEGGLLSVEFKVLFHCRCTTFPRLGCSHCCGGPSPVMPLILALSWPPDCLRHSFNMNVLAPPVIGGVPVYSFLFIPWMFAHNFFTYCNLRPEVSGAYRR